MVQKVSRQPPTSETGVRSRHNSCEIRHSIFAVSSIKPMLHTSHHLRDPLISQTSGRSLRNFKYSDALPETVSTGNKRSFLLLGLKWVTGKQLIYARGNTTMVEMYRRTWDCVPNTLVIISHTPLAFMVIYCRYKFRLTRLFTVQAKQNYFSLAFR